MQSAKYNVAVLLIFFNRPETFRQVFEAVKKARPSKLYLYQDGARNDADREKIMACRSIAEEIDWECAVYKWYQEKNVGCDPSGYKAQNWFFQNEEQGIVLEDDVVPNESFFPFCLELLNRYKCDERINMICGMNNLDILDDVQESYFFSEYGSIWGWASWRRVVQTWDENYTWMENKNTIADLKRTFASDNTWKMFYETAIRHAKEGKAYHETINGVSQKLYHRLNIIPKYNMITNVGATADSTHSNENVQLIPKFQRSLMYKKTYEINFPLIHPKYVIQNHVFDADVEKRATLWNRFLVLIERVCLILRYEGVGELIKKIRKKLKG